MSRENLVMGQDVQLGRDVEIGANVVIHDGTVIGDGCVIQAHAVIGEHVVECVLDHDVDSVRESPRNFLCLEGRSGRVQVAAQEERRDGAVDPVAIAGAEIAGPDGAAEDRIQVEVADVPERRIRRFPIHLRPSLGIAA